MHKFISYMLSTVVVFAVCVVSPVSGAPADQRRAIAIAAKARHINVLLATPGVVGAGIGQRGDGTPVIRIFTARPGVAGLPNALDKVPVEVEVTGRIVATPLRKASAAAKASAVDPTARFSRPVPTGVSTGHPAITAGTVGARVKDAGGNVYALSNNHVYAKSNAATAGDPVLQPGSVDGGTDPDDTIGALHDFQTILFDGSDNIMDAAIAVSSEAELGNATPSDGYGMPNAMTATVFIGQAVQKYGRTTSLTLGMVAETDVTVNVCYEVLLDACIKVARFVGQFAVSGESFGAGGDSGSLIVTGDGHKNPVGLLFAGSSTRAIANPIGVVLNRFGVSIDGEPPGLPPRVTISSPTGGSTFASDASIAFAGSATDSEDGDLTASLAWASDHDGAMGNGGNVSTTLSDGDHIVTASVTDSAGNVTTHTVAVIVGTPPLPPAEGMSVASITYATKGGKNGKKHLSVTLVLLDGQGNPVSGASVDIQLSNSTAGQVWLPAGLSSTNGTLTVTLSNAPSGTYTTTVRAVTANGLTWDGVTPPNAFTK